MKTRFNWKSFAVLQVLVLCGFGLAYALGGPLSRELVRQEFFGQDPFVAVDIPRNDPLRVRTFYDRPDIVSDEDLAAVLKQVQPPFGRKEMSPNHVEHALRTWGVDATFQDPEIISGQEMLEFLTDHAKYVESWGEEIRPLLLERPAGIEVRWGTETGASYHHDHLLASVTEAGATLDTPVYGAFRTNATLYDVIQQSLHDFRLDEREYEWTAMAFGFWIPPTREWIGGDGRRYSFDLIAKRLMRASKPMGVCAGTHRVYSLMVLIQLDDEYGILSDEIRGRVYAFLERVRDNIIESQFEEGYWPSNWPDGADAVANPIDEPEYRRIIATGHHLEWLSIAPKDLHPPDEQIKNAADWIIRVTKEQTREQIKQRYTFFSHVGLALANWRQVRPADFWREWEAQHPFVPEGTDADEARIETDAPPNEPGT